MPVSSRQNVVVEKTRTVEMQNGNDTIQLGAGITADDIDVERSGNDLILALRNGGDTGAIDTLSDRIVIKNFSNVNSTIENLSFVDGTTVDLSTWTIGTAGNDTLSGTSRMYGGRGNDTYTVDSATDIIVENVNAGIDTVNSSISYTLGANLENLTLNGTAAINATGNDANNVIRGNSGNNVLYGGNGTNLLYGADGSDEAQYSGIRNAFNIRQNNDGTYTVDRGTLHDTLNSIESIRFDEGTMSASYALEVRGTQETLARYYAAFFDRIPDKEGLAYWVNDLVDIAHGGGGNTMEGVQQLFYWFSEYATEAVSLDKGQFVTLLYSNILDRVPDQAEYDYWVTELNQRGDCAGMIASFANSEEFAVKTQESIDVFLAGVSLEGYILI
jgi:Ca2+-binding RTX toxin-like protein